MLKLKRGLILLLSLAIIFSMSACKNNTVQKADEPSDSVPADAYEIQWYFVNSNAQKDVLLVEEEANKYLKDIINATIKLNCLDWGTYSNKVSTMLASGSPMDMVFTSSGTLSYSQNVAKGNYLDISELITKYAPKTYEMLSSVIDAARINGKLYGIPANKDTAHRYGFVYNKAIAEKHNLDLSNVKSFEDLEPVLSVIKEKEPELIALGIGGSRTPYDLIDFDFISGFNQVGAFYSDKQPDVIINQFESPEFKEAVLLARKYYQDGYIYKDAATAKNFDQLQKQGQMFTYMEKLQPTKLNEINAASANVEYDAVYVSEILRINDDVKGSMIAIPRTSKNPERVMRFIELFNNDVYLNNLINFGIEGKHYTKKSENVIEPVKDSGYDQVGMQWEFGNTFINYFLPNMPSDRNEKLKEFNEKAKNMKSLGFSFDNEPIKVEVSSCANVIQEYLQNLTSGAVDVETILPQFIQKLKQAGADKIIQEEQLQYDNWLKEQK